MKCELNEKINDIVCQNDPRQTRCANVQTCEVQLYNRPISFILFLIPKMTFLACQMYEACLRQMTGSFQRMDRFAYRWISDQNRNQIS